MNVPPLELERLLADERWLRALARRLARDSGEAEDLVQEVSLAWLAAPPVVLTRRWLAGILRRSGRTRRRAEARRRAREEVVARDEAIPATDEVVAELELANAVGRALLALEEPYRRTLVRRFHRGETLAEIASAEGLALASVHQRIRTGLARLRTRLDRDHGVRRSAWATVALSLAESRELSPETVLMTSGTKLATLAAVVLGSLGVAWWARQERTPAPTLEAARRSTLDSAELEPALDPVRRAPASARAAATDGPQEPSLSASTALLHGRVQRLDGSALADVEVAFEGRPAGVRSDAAGEFALAPHEDDEARLELRSAHHATVVPGSRALPIVIGSEVRTLVGRVLALDGSAVSGAEVSLRLRERLFRDLGLIRPPWSDLESRWVARTDARGRFTLTAPIGAGLFLSGEAEGYLPGELDLATPLAPELLLELVPRDEQARARGRVLAPDGQPCAGASVSAGEDIVHSDERGEFDFVLPRRDGDEGWMLRAFHAPFAAASLELTRTELEIPLVLTLGPEPLAIEGRVLAADGRALPDVTVYLHDATFFGLSGGGIGDEGGFWRGLFLEQELGGAAAVRSAADGSFRLGGLTARRYQLGLHDPRTLRRAGPFDVAAGARALELVLPDEDGLRRVAGRVVRPDGSPLSGVTLRARRAADQLASARPPELPGSSALRVSDAEGRFDFGELVTPGSFLELDHPHATWRACALDGRDPAELELVLALRCALQVDLTRSPGLADRMRVLDSSGTALLLWVPSGSVASFDEDWRLGPGLSNVIEVPETARTLVLYSGADEVLRLPLALDPAERCTIAP